MDSAPRGIIYENTLVRNVWNQGSLCDAYTHNNDMSFLHSFLGRTERKKYAHREDWTLNRTWCIYKNINEGKREMLGIFQTKAGLWRRTTKQWVISPQLLTLSKTKEICIFVLIYLFIYLVLLFSDCFFLVTASGCFHLVLKHKDRT